MLNAGDEAGIDLVDYCFSTCRKLALRRYFSPRDYDDLYKGALFGGSRIFCVGVVF